MIMSASGVEDQSIGNLTKQDDDVSENVKSKNNDFISKTTCTALHTHHAYAF